MITAANETTKRVQEVLVTGDGRLMVDNTDSEPFYVQGEIFSFEQSKSLTAGAAAVSLINSLPASQLLGFTPYFEVLSAVNGSETTATFKLEASPDGVRWFPVVDSAGSERAFTLACSSNSTPTRRCFPPVEICGAFVKVTASCTGVNATVTVDSAWRP